MKEKYILPFSFDSFIFFNISFLVFFPLDKKTVQHRHLLMTLDDYLLDICLLIFPETLKHVYRYLLFVFVQIIFYNVN